MTSQQFVIISSRDPFNDNSVNRKIITITGEMSVITDFIHIRIQ